MCWLSIFFPPVIHSSVPRRFLLAQCAAASDTWRANFFWLRWRVTIPLFCGRRQLTEEVLWPSVAMNKQSRWLERDSRSWECSNIQILSCQICVTSLLLWYFLARQPSWFLDDAEIRRWKLPRQHCVHEGLVRFKPIYCRWHCFLFLFPSDSSSSECNEEVFCRSRCNSRVGVDQRLLFFFTTDFSFCWEMPGWPGLFLFCFFFPTAKQQRREVLVDYGWLMKLPHTAVCHGAMIF